MVKIPKEVAGFVALPLTFKTTTTPTEEAKHYLFLKPHDPNVPDEDASRSMFLVNIPVTSTEEHLRHLFANQIGAGRVEKVYFSEDAPGRASIAAAASAKSSRKRKRMSADELEAGLDGYNLPEVFESEIRSSGSTAIVVFVDKSSMELSLKCAKRAAKRGSSIVWGAGLEGKIAPLGLKRYERFNQLQFLSRRELLRSVDGYMTAYAQMEEARAHEAAKKRQMPDEEGFVTVTRGAKGGLRKEEAKELGEKQKEKNKGLDDFYRFQMREKRKEQQGEMLRKFEDDKRKVAEMRQRRGKARPE